MKDKEKENKEKNRAKEKFYFYMDVCVHKPHALINFDYLYTHTHIHHYTSLWCPGFFYKLHIKYFYCFIICITISYLFSLFINIYIISRSHVNTKLIDQEPLKVIYANN